MILIGDPKGVVPDSMSGKLIAATHSCVAVGTLSEHDGETTILLSNEGPPAEFQAVEPLFDREVKTSSRKLTVSSVLDEILLELSVPERSRVRIWVNHRSEPDSIAIVVEPVTSDA